MNKKTNENTGKSVTGQSFIYGAIILTIGMAIVKLVGALFKVPLKEVIGEYGMGLFSVAYNFYVPIHSLAFAGLPIAISRLVAESYSKGRYRDIGVIKKVAFPIFIALGLIGTAAMLVLAPYYCKNIIGNENAVLPMLVLAPAVLFGCLGATYRGMSEGMKNMYPTAVSEIIEALSKMIVGLGAAIFITKYCESEYIAGGTVFGAIMNTADDAALYTLSYAAAGAIFGVTVGSFLSFMFLYIRQKVKRSLISEEMIKGAPRPYKKKTIRKKLIKTAVPVAIGSVTISIAGLIDTTFLQSRISSAMSEAPNIILNMYNGLIPDSYIRNPETIPNFLFGCYTLAMTVYMLVPTITQGFSTSALPNITALWAKGDKAGLKDGVESVIRITALFCFPAGLGITAISDSITTLLYGTDPSGQIIASVMSVLGIAAIFSALLTPISSMLQAVGRADIPVKVMLAGMFVKVIINYLLSGIPQVNIIGAGIGTICCYGFMVIAEIMILCRVLKLRFDMVSVFVKPLISAVFSAISAFAVNGIVIANTVIVTRANALVSVALSVLSAVVVYIICILILKGINKKDIFMLPKGEKIAKMLEKRNWI